MENMENNPVYDFYKVGQSHAADNIMELKKISQMFERDFGKAAKDAFELGVASILPAFEEYVVSTSVTIKDAQSATLNYGEDNKRNNSYFDRAGTSKRFDEDGNYIEPAVRR